MEKYSLSLGAFMFKLEESLKIGSGYADSNRQGPESIRVIYSGEKKIRKMDQLRRTHIL